MRRSPQAARVRRGGHLRRLSSAALVSLSALLASLVSTDAAAQAEAVEALAAGSVRVLHAPRQRGLARQVLAEARRPFPHPGLGLRAVPESTTIILAPSPADFAAATGGGAPEWAGGVAIPELRRIVLPSYPSANVRRADADVLLRHEVAHLVLHQAVPGAVPRWFDEGYAEIAAGGWDAEGAWQLRAAFVVGGVPPLDSLTLGWPAGSERARFAYLLSATAVDHLRRRAGEGGMELFFRNWRQEGSFDRALRTTFGLTLGQFEEEWVKDVKRRYGWLQGLTSAAVIWLAASLLALVLWIPRRRRNRRRMDAMRAEERMLPPPREDGLDVEYPLPEPND